MAQHQVVVVSVVQRSRMRLRQAQKYYTARPTLSRAQIQAKGTHETPERIEDAKPIKFMAQDVIWQQKEYRRNLERAAIVYANEFGHKQPETGVCLPNVAIYAAGYRKSKQLTAR